MDNIRPGADFGQYIETILPRCRVVLVLIGPNWIDAKDEAGRHRLDDPHDWVRIEIETALNSGGLDVVPVLVNGARMPRAEELPQSLHPLLRRNAAIIRRDPDFHDDIARLSAALRASVQSGVLDLAKLGGERKATSTKATSPSALPAWLLPTCAVAAAVLAVVVWAPWRNAATVAPEHTESAETTTTAMHDSNTASTTTTAEQNPTAMSIAVTDRCASTNSAWARLRGSSDRGQLQRFVASAPAQCAVRAQAQQRLATIALPQSMQTRTDVPDSTSNASVAASVSGSTWSGTLSGWPVTYRFNADHSFEGEQSRGLTWREAGANVEIVSNSGSPYERVIRRATVMGDALQVHILDNAPGLGRELDTITLRRQ